MVWKFCFFVVLLSRNIHPACFKTSSDVRRWLHESTLMLKARWPVYVIHKSWTAVWVLLLVPVKPWVILYKWKNTHPRRKIKTSWVGSRKLSWVCLPHLKTFFLTYKLKKVFYTDKILSQDHLLSVFSCRSLSFPNFHSLYLHVCLFLSWLPPSLCFVSLALSCCRHPLTLKHPTFSRDVPED